MPPIQLKVSPLPTDPPLLAHHSDTFSWGKTKENANSAYNRCLGFEQDALANAEQLMYVRVLGYFIQQFQSNPTALQTLATDIHSCTDSDQLVLLGKFYNDHVLRLFKKYKCRTSAPSDHLSRHTFEDLQESVKARLDEGPKNHSDAKQFALLRDGYKCILTGLYDIGYAMTYDLNEPAAITDCAHILSSSTFSSVSNPDPANTKREHTATVLSILKSFGYDTTNLLGDKVDSLNNVMTLEVGLHGAFDQLAIWFEATKTENKYTIQYLQAYAGNPTFRILPDFVTFSTETALPLPSKQLLELHATCCKVARLSGAAEYIEKHQRDEEETRVLSNDGSSKGLLDSVLHSRLVGFIGVEA